MGAASQRAGRANEDAVARFYSLCGCTVLDNRDPGIRKGVRGHRGTPGRTPGIPDFLVVHEGAQRSWWHEAKSGKAKLTRGQERFRCLMTRNGGLPVVVGGVAAARTHLEEVGILYPTADTDPAPRIRLRLPKPLASETCR